MEDASEATSHLMGQEEWKQTRDPHQDDAYFANGTLASSMA